MVGGKILYLRCPVDGINDSGGSNGWVYWMALMGFLWGFMGG